MTDRVAATALRLLAPRARALGPDDHDSLENIITNELPDGSLCWVINTHALYVLDKSLTTAPNDSLIIQPLAGPGRWVLLVGSQFNPFQIASIFDAVVFLNTPPNFTPTAAAGQNVWSALLPGGAGTFVFSPAPPPTLWSLDSSTGILTYHGPIRIFEVTVFMTVSSSTPNARTIDVSSSPLGSFLGTILDDNASQIETTTASAIEFQAISAAKAVQMVANQTIQPMLRNVTAAEDVIVKRMTMTVRATS
jgi:hypothetical protein